MCESVPDHEQGGENGSACWKSPGSGSTSVSVAPEQPSPSVELEHVGVLGAELDDTWLDSGDLTEAWCFICWPESAAART
jgi:hypothetical protein